MLSTTSYQCFWPCFLSHVCSFASFARLQEEELEEEEPEQAKGRSSKASKSKSSSRSKSKGTSGSKRKKSQFIEAEADEVRCVSSCMAVWP
jgi:hypothetical protein